MVVWVTLLVGIHLLFAAEDILDSGGPLTPQQAAYDVHFYDLAVQVFPNDSTIAGTVEVAATMVQPYDWLVLNLDTVFTIQSIERMAQDAQWVSATFYRRIGELWIYLGRTHQPGESIRVRVTYRGRPRIAPRPPWNGGFTWARTPSGKPWIATTCQEEGADIWWPVKDHVSDEPDSMAIHVRVPRELICVSNGRFKGKESHRDGTVTYHWFVSTPINTYNVALNIAPYHQTETVFRSVTGEKFPVYFWVLPEYKHHAQAFLKEITRQLQFFERYLGPFPFRLDKCGVVQTPHLGMEHQTAIAYGAGFDNTVLTEKDWGFDALLHHEMSHEWWGNLVTNFDWRDMWLHEGFGTYMQALYVEYLHGRAAYLEYMNFLHRFRNDLPVAPRETQTADQIYQAPIYYKGAWVLHTLRYLIGDSLFFRSLRRMAYPTPEMEKITDGRQCRFATTDDYLQLVNRLTNRQLDWFFEVYLRHPQLPQLAVAFQGDTLALHWVLPGSHPFPMPLEIEVQGNRRRVPLGTTIVRIPISSKDTLLIDPEHWVLFEYQDLEAGKALIKQHQWEAAQQRLQPLKRIENLRPEIEALLKHIQFMKSHPGLNLQQLFSSWKGSYRVNKETTLHFLIRNNHFFIQTNRRTFETVLPVGKTQLVEIHGRYSYSFQRGKDGTQWLIKRDISGRELLRAHRE